MDTVRTLIVANWKMHGSLTLAETLAQAATVFSRTGMEIVLCPPFPYLTHLADLLAGSMVHLGAQDCHAQPQGAFTGDVSAPMLKEAGCSHVIVGHSERRQYHGENDEVVHAKTFAAIASGLHPVLCVGESLEQRESGQAETMVCAQLEAAIPANASTASLTIAYEPIWAIGTGKTPTEAEITTMHAAIHHRAVSLLSGDAHQVRVLYGGSVKAENAPSILKLPGVNGVLVGGASLEAEAFSSIIRAASE